MRLLLCAAIAAAGFECRIYPLSVAAAAMMLCLLCVVLSWRSRPPPLQFTYDGQGGWQVRGERLSLGGTLGSGAYRSGLFIVLPVRTAAGRVHRFTIWRDAIDGAGFSFLHLYLLSDGHTVAQRRSGLAGYLRSRQDDR